MFFGCGKVLCKAEVIVIVSCDVSELHNSFPCIAAASEVAGDHSTDTEGRCCWSDGFYLDKSLRLNLLASPRFAGKAPQPNGSAEGNGSIFPSVSFWWFPCQHFARVCAALGAETST